MPLIHLQIMMIILSDCSSVRSVAVDALSRYLVTGGADSKLAIWFVKSRKCARVINMGSSVSHIRLHEESNMVAVALDDFSLAIVDLETQRIVRKFPGKPLIFVRL